MISHPEARTLARELADAATHRDAAAWRVGLDAMERLDGASWLVVDQAARAFRHEDGQPVSGGRGWLGATLDEPSGFVAAITSLHVDGWFRERAVLALSDAPSAVAVPALAVRLLDHVPEVRALAWQVLQPFLGLESAEGLLDVVLAGSGRQHGPDALDRVTTALFDRVPTDRLLARMTASRRRRVRRWAFEVAHDLELLTDDHLVTVARGDRDQWLQARCAEWLTAGPDPRVLTALLEARSVEARLVALVHLPETDVSDQALGASLVDGAPRVREHARVRARRRGWDVAAFYRQRLTDTTAPPRVVASCLEGLALIGDQGDLDAAVGHLRHASARVRAAAVGAVAARATRGQGIDLLTPVLLDTSPRVGAAAARQLGRLGAPTSVTDEAWTSAQPSSRYAAWLLTRARGSWARVEADLRAAADPDTALSTRGRTGIRAWLQAGAATTWEPLTDARRRAIAALLTEAGIGIDEQRSVAFHAAIEMPSEDVRRPRADDAPESPRVPRSAWARLLRRR